MEYRRHTTVNKKPLVKIIILVVSLVCIALGIRSLFFAKDSHSFVSPLPDEIVQTKSENQNKTITSKLFQPKTKNPQKLRESIQKTINNRWKNYSVLVKDLNSDFEMGINETVMYTAASVNKIPILAALYYEAEKGNIDLDKDITIQANDIQDYGTGSIRYEKPGSTYSIKTLANLMMKQSDNTAAYVLSNHIVGFETIQKHINSWSLTQTDIVKNDTSNHDMLTLMEKLYKGNIVNAALTQEMLGFMKNTDFEDRLPGLLPDGVSVYHKIGDAVGSIHDVGIVTTKDKQYYIGVFTNDVDDDEETKKIIAEISKVVYEYMSN